MLDRGGRALKGIFYSGKFIRAQVWETIGLAGWNDELMRGNGLIMRLCLLHVTLRPPNCHESALGFIGLGCLNRIENFLRRKLGRAAEERGGMQSPRVIVVLVGGSFGLLDEMLRWDR